jgi:hypothetical protein
MRAICAVGGLLLTMASALPAPPEVDAVTFALAFRAGDADRYKNTQVSGTGTAYHGAITERIADGSTRRSLVVTLGSATADGHLAVLKTWDDFAAAERARTTLVVALSGPDLPAVPAQPASIKFSGVYDGQVRTIMRLPQAGEGAAPDAGPCPGEQAGRTDAKASFYCAALLTGATATVIQQ